MAERQKRQKKFVDKHLHILGCDVHPEITKDTLDADSPIYTYPCNMHFAYNRCAMRCGLRCPCQLDRIFHKKRQVDENCDPERKKSKARPDSPLTDHETLPAAEVVIEKSILSPSTAAATATSVEEVPDSSEQRSNIGTPVTLPAAVDDNSSTEVVVENASPPPPSATEVTVEEVPTNVITSDFISQNSSSTADTGLVVAEVCLVSADIEVNLSRTEQRSNIGTPVTLPAALIDHSSIEVVVENAPPPPSAAEVTVEVVPTNVITSDFISQNSSSTADNGLVVAEVCLVPEKSPTASAVQQCPEVNDLTTATSICVTSLPMEDDGDEVEENEALTKATKKLVWNDSNNKNFFLKLEDRLKKAESKTTLIEAQKSLGVLCFVNTKYQNAICDGCVAGLITVDPESEVPILQNYSRGLNFISLIDDFVIQRGDVFTTAETIEGHVVKSDIVFISATAHAPNGDIKLHFWNQHSGAWLRAKWSDFKRHWSRSSPMNPTLVRKENEPQVYVPRSVYMSYFSQPEINFHKQSLFFSRPSKRIQTTAEIQKVNDAKQIAEDLAEENKLRKNSAIRRRKELTSLSASTPTTTPLASRLPNKSATTSTIIHAKAQGLLQAQLAAAESAKGGESAAEVAAGNDYQMRFNEMVALQRQLQDQLAQVKEQANFEAKKAIAKAQQEAEDAVQKAKVLAREEVNNALAEVKAQQTIRVTHIPQEQQQIPMQAQEQYQQHSSQALAPSMHMMTAAPGPAVVAPSYYSHAWYEQQQNHLVMFMENQQLRNDFAALQRSKDLAERETYMKHQRQFFGHK